MYLKELTLRGFKSFANPTTLRFEPGITAIVGPNGSGKSNIVDAFAWVMGEQGARALRGSSMEDVIFAGTATRPAMGRAQVSLTIDNSDHALDIDYDEVTLTRTIYRSGGSEYAINGSDVRLLDVQDLLSDAGLGQQMHVIVGQGQLSRILNSDPQGHRAIIEEAAGILKHRKRKQRSLRRLSAAKTNLDRLDDLLGEIDRQMRPLARQAKASRKADAVRAIARDARARLLADDASQLLEQREKTIRQLEQARSDLRQQRVDLARLKVRIEDIETHGAGADPQLARLSESAHHLTLLDGRFESLADLAGERARAAADELGRLEARPLSDPDVLSARADELAGDLTRAMKQREQAEQRQQEGTKARADAESRLASLRQTLSQLRQARAEHESQIGRLEQLLAGQKAAITAYDQRLADTRRRGEDVSERLKSNQQEVARLSAQGTAEDAGLAEKLDACRAQLSDLADELATARTARTDLDNRRIRLTARSEALGDTIRSRHEGTSLASAEGVSPLGPLSEQIRVADGWEEALAAALSTFSDALVLGSPDQIPAALAAARADKAGRTAVLAPSDAGPSAVAASSGGKAVSDGSEMIADEKNAPHAPADGEVVPAIGLIAPLGEDSHATDSHGADPHGKNPDQHSDARTDQQTDQTAEVSQGVVRSLAVLLDGVGVTQDADTAFDACRTGEWARVVTKAGRSSPPPPPSPSRSAPRAISPSSPAATPPTSRPQRSPRRSGRPTGISPS